MFRNVAIRLSILIIFILTPCQVYAENTQKNNTDQNYQGTVEKALNDPNLNEAFGKIFIAGIASGLFGGFISIFLQRLNASSSEEELAKPFWLDRLVVGAGTGVVVIWFLKPNSFLALVTFSIISGSVGPSIFVALQNRIQSMLQLRRAQDEAEQERIKAERETIKANPSLAENAEKTLNIIRDRFRQIRDKNEAPSSQEWDLLWEAIRDLETITPKQTENIAKPLDKLQNKLNGKALKQEPQLTKQVNNAIDETRALIRNNKTNTPANSES